MSSSILQRRKQRPGVEGGAVAKSAKRRKHYREVLTDTPTYKAVVHSLPPDDVLRLLASVDESAKISGRIHPNGCVVLCIDNHCCLWNVDRPNLSVSRFQFSTQDPNVKADSRLVCPIFHKTRLICLLQLSSKGTAVLWNASGTKTQLEVPLDRGDEVTAVEYSKISNEGPEYKGDPSTVDHAFVVGTLQGRHYSLTTCSGIQEIRSPPDLISHGFSKLTNLLGYGTPQSPAINSIIIREVRLQESHIYFLSNGKVECWKMRFFRDNLSAQRLWVQHFPIFSGFFSQQLGEEPSSVSLVDLAVFRSSVVVLASVYHQNTYYYAVGIFQCEEDKTPEKCIHINQVRLRGQHRNVKMSVNLANDVYSIYLSSAHHLHMYSIRAPSVQEEDPVETTHVLEGEEYVACGAFDGSCLLASKSRIHSVRLAPRVICDAPESKVEGDAVIAPQIAVSSSPPSVIHTHGNHGLNLKFSWKYYQDKKFNLANDYAKSVCGLDQRSLNTLIAETSLTFLDSESHDVFASHVNQKKSDFESFINFMRAFPKHYGNVLWDRISDDMKWRMHQHYGLLKAAVAAEKYFTTEAYGEAEKNVILGGLAELIAKRCEGVRRAEGLNDRDILCLKITQFGELLDYVGREFDKSFGSPNSRPSEKVLEETCKIFLAVDGLFETMLKEIDYEVIDPPKLKKDYEKLVLKHGLNWCDTLSVSKSLRKQIDRITQLTEKLLFSDFAGTLLNLETRMKLYESLVRLGGIYLRGYERRLLASGDEDRMDLSMDSDEKGENIPFSTARKDIISSLERYYKYLRLSSEERNVGKLALKQAFRLSFNDPGDMTTVMSFACQFRAFDSLVELCIKYDPRMLLVYLTAFERDFAREMFQYFYSQKSLSQLLGFGIIDQEGVTDDTLNNFNKWLSEYLRDHQLAKIAWMHDIYANDFKSCAKSLNSLAQNQKNDVMKKLTLLSLTKLSLFASGLQNDENIPRLNRQMAICDAQLSGEISVCNASMEDSLSQSLNAHRSGEMVGRNSDRVLSPEEVIRMLIDRGVEYHKRHVENSCFQQAFYVLQQIAEENKDSNTVDDEVEIWTALFKADDETVWNQIIDVYQRENDASKWRQAAQTTLLSQTLHQLAFSPLKTQLVENLKLSFEKAIQKCDEKRFAIIFARVFMEVTNLKITYVDHQNQQTISMS